MSTREERLKAQFRMRRLRGAEGRTLFDKARDHATSILIERHRAEFDKLRWQYIREKNA